ncbi:MAG: transposase [Chromatiaceae bacterium]|nr:transposase [Chromatiaceae bacterium]
MARLITRFYQAICGEGRPEGIAVILMGLVTAKCGLPTPAMRHRLASADTLLSWSEPILKADSLDEVFRDFH